MRNMTPKKKAKELIDTFDYSCRECDTIDNSKEFAYRCCLEIIKAVDSSNDEDLKEYWDKVKEELLKL